MEPPPNETLPSPMIMELFVSRDGTLWIGSRNGLVSWKDNALKGYQDLNGETDGSDGTVSLAVSDDGAGFDASRLTTSGGLGLIMMRERAGQLNGTFEFQTAPGRGTTIKVVIPFR